MQMGATRVRYSHLFPTVCYRFPCLDLSLVSVYTTEPAGIPTGSDYLMCSNVVTVGKNVAMYEFIFCFRGSPKPESNRHR
jgi:hypothetical protein